MINIEPILQHWRIYKIKPYLNTGGVLVDLGCDNPPPLLNRVAPQMRRCIGIDSIVENKVTGNIKFIKLNIKKTLPLKDAAADNVTLLAVLEHLKYPEPIINESHRILKKGGILLLTVPAPKSRPLLEFLGRIGFVRKEMIDQHQNYFTKKRLKVMAQKAGFKQVQVSNFQLGFNTLMVAKK